MSFDVTIAGLSELLDALDKWPDIMRPILEETSEAALLSLIPDLANYPPPPPGSTYRRTGNLGRLWVAARPEFEGEASGFEARVGNARPGGEFVQGEFQAEAHQGIWQTVEDIVSAHQLEIEAYYERALQKVADQVGGE